MTANYSENKVHGDIGAAGVTASWNIANFVMSRCGLSKAKADLQGFENHENGAGLLYDCSSGAVS